MPVQLDRRNTFVSTANVPIKSVPRCCQKKSQTNATISDNSEVQFPLHDRLNHFLNEHEDFGSQSEDTNLYGYVANDPINEIDPSGLSSLAFNRGSETITVTNGSGQTVGIYSAGNNTTANSGGPWPNGTFPFSHYLPHPESSATGSFGSNGNFVFTVPGRIGKGFHFGGRGPTSNTEGSVRTTDDATGVIKNLNAITPLTSITIGN